MRKNIFLSLLTLILVFTAVSIFAQTPPRIMVQKLELEEGEIMDIVTNSGNTTSEHYIFRALHVESGAEIGTDLGTPVTSIRINQVGVGSPDGYVAAIVNQTAFPAVWPAGDTVRLIITYIATNEVATKDIEIPAGTSAIILDAPEDVMIIPPFPEEDGPAETVTLPVIPGTDVFTPVFGGTNVLLGFGNVTGGGNITVNFFNSGAPNPDFGRQAPDVFSNYYWNITDDGVIFTEGSIYLDVNNLAGVNVGALVPGEQTLANGGIVIYKRAGAGDPFAALATDYNTAMAGMLSAPIGDGFSEFALGTNNNIHTLPVELSSFTANATANMFVELQWVSETETNMLGYHIYRSDVSSLSDALQITNQPIPANNSSETQTYTYVDENVIPGNTYYYWLQTVDLDLTVGFHGPVSVTLEEEIDVPDPVYVTALSQNFPNPFNPQTTIAYSLREDTDMMELKIYNILGQVVRTVHSGPQAKGEYTFVWNGRDDNNRSLSSGIYFYRMTTPNYSKVHKMMLLK